MNSIVMLRAAVTLLGIAALGGITMALIRFSRKQNPPSWLAMLHGLLAASGLTLLLYALFAAGIGRMAQAGLGFLLLASVGGIVLNQKYQWRSVLLSPAWVIGHAILAVIGFTLLLFAVRSG